MFQIVSYVSDKFGGESVLAIQEVLTNLRRHVGGWTNSALRIFLRHDSPDGEHHPLHMRMMHVNHVSNLSFPVDQSSNSRESHVQLITCIEPN
jgi:hypothetical protein